MNKCIYTIKVINDDRTYKINTFYKKDATKIACEKYYDIVDYKDRNNKVLLYKMDISKAFNIYNTYKCNNEIQKFMNNIITYIPFTNTKMEIKTTKSSTFLDTDKYIGVFTINQIINSKIDLKNKRFFELTADLYNNDNSETFNIFYIKFIILPPTKSSLWEYKIEKLIIEDPITNEECFKNYIKMHELLSDIYYEKCTGKHYSDMIIELSLGIKDIKLIYESSGIKVNILYRKNGMPAYEEVTSSQDYQKKLHKYWKRLKSI